MPPSPHACEESKALRAAVGDNSLADHNVVLWKDCYPSKVIAKLIRYKPVQILSMLGQESQATQLFPNITI